MQPILCQMKEQFEHNLTGASKLKLYHAELEGFFSRYEDQNLLNYSNLDLDRLVFKNPNDADNLLSRFQLMANNLRNPYVDMYHWVQGELFDLNALNALVERRIAFED